MIQIIYKFILEAGKVAWLKGMNYRRAPEFSFQHPVGWFLPSSAPTHMYTYT